MFGIPAYEPNFFDKAELFIKVIGPKLSQALGSTLEDYWLMWDTMHNEWYNDGPVILQILNVQFEFTAYNLDQFSLTFDKIDRNRDLDWYGIKDEIPLIWKNRADQEINKLIGRKIKSIHLIEYNSILTVIGSKNNPQSTGNKIESGFMINGIEFEFEKKGMFDKNNFLKVFNALDSNRLTTKKQKKDNQFRKINIQKSIT